MAVVITEDEHITIIHYAEGKRPIKIEPFVVTSAEDADILQDIIRFIHVEANSPHHIAKMEDAKFLHWLNYWRRRFATRSPLKPNTALISQRLGALFYLCYKPQPKPGSGWTPITVLTALSCNS